MILCLFNITAPACAGTWHFFQLVSSNQFRPFSSKLPIRWGSKFPTELQTDEAYHIPLSSKLYALLKAS